MKALKGKSVVLYLNVNEDIVSELTVNFLCTKPDRDPNLNQVLQVLKHYHKKVK